MKALTPILDWMTSSAKARGRELAKTLDYSKKDFESFRWDVYNSACLGCRRRMCPPKGVWNKWTKKYELGLCSDHGKPVSGHSRKCPGRVAIEKWHREAGTMDA